MQGGGGVEDQDVVAAAADDGLAGAWGVGVVGAKAEGRLCGERGCDRQEACENQRIFRGGLIKNP